MPTAPKKDDTSPTADPGIPESDPSVTPTKQPGDPSEDDDYDLSGPLPVFLPAPDSP